MIDKSDLEEYLGKVNAYQQTSLRDLTTGRLIEQTWYGKQPQAVV